MLRFVHVVHVVCEYAQVVNIELRLSDIYRLVNTICGRNVGAMALVLQAPRRDATSE